MILSAKATARFNSSVFTHMSDSEVVCVTDAWQVIITKEDGTYTAVVENLDVHPDSRYVAECLACGIGYTSYECARHLYMHIIETLTNATMHEARILGEVLSTVFK